jgi:hypothetical protein
MINVYGAVGGIRIGRGNRGTRRNPPPVPLCQPQVPHELIWVRTSVTAVGSQRQTSRDVTLWNRVEVDESMEERVTSIVRVMLCFATILLVTLTSETSDSLQTTRRYNSEDRNLRSFNMLTTARHCILSWASWNTLTRLNGRLEFCVVYITMLSVELTI